jgi:hypothetical protein
MDQATIQKRKIKLLSNVDKVTKFILPYVVAAMFLVVFLVVTNKHGLGVSTDSVSYIGAAESIIAEGKLQIPVTTWDSESQYATLSHFPPLLPLALAFLSWLLNTDPISASRWLNALCIVAILLALLLPMVESYLRSFVMVTILTGGSLLYMHLWVWSEPLFLLLVIISFWVGIKVLMQADNNIHYLVILAILSGLATLTRYAGVYLAIGFISLLVLRRDSIQTKFRQIVLYMSIYVATISPWFIWLSTVNESARELGFYTEGIEVEVAHHLILTVVHWLIPYWLPVWVKILFLAAGVVASMVWIIWLYYRRIDYKVALPVYVSSVLFVIYLTFVLTARLFADSGIPLDDRLLSPALIHMALGLSYAAESLIKPRFYVALAFLTLGLIVIDNVYAISPFLNHSTSFGIGFSSSRWKGSETITWLQDLPSDVTIFSNGADGICAVLPVTAKYTPTVSELAQISEFEQRVKQTGPAVIVLFNNMHTDWLLGQEQLAHLENWEREVFSDSIVLSWGLEPSIGE